MLAGICGEKFRITFYMQRHMFPSSSLVWLSDFANASTENTWHPMPSGNPYRLLFRYEIVVLKKVCMACSTKTGSIIGQSPVTSHITSALKALAAPKTDPSHLLHRPETLYSAYLHIFQEHRHSIVASSLPRYR